MIEHTQLFKSYFLVDIDRLRKRLMMPSINFLRPAFSCWWWCECWGFLLWKIEHDITGGSSSHTTLKESTWPIQKSNTSQKVYHRPLAFSRRCRRLHSTTDSALFPLVASIGRRVYRTTSHDQGRSHFGITPHHTTHPSHHTMCCDGITPHFSDHHTFWFLAY